MTEKELISTLIEQGYVVQLGVNDFVISNKLVRDAAVVAPTTEFEVKVVDAKETLRKFIKDCKIPFRAKTSIGSFYQLAAESDYARQYLQKLLRDNIYKYEDMVSATTMYYGNDKMARVTLTNYFKQGVFDQVMTEFLANPQHSNVIGTVASKTNKISL